jgi:DNA polymerase-3 subunit alpha
MLQRLAALFPGSLYVELMRHGDEAEERIDGPLIDLAYKHDLPVVATNDCYFAGPDMFEAHDALLCIAEGAHIGDPDRRRLTPQHGFRPAAEMRALFADIPEAVDNTLVIARRCAFMPDQHAPILPAFPTAGDRTETDQLRAEAEEGLRLRLTALGIGEHDAKPYRDRLAFELDVIVKMGFPGYFLSFPTSSSGPRRMAYRWDRGAARARARSRHGRSASPISIRCAGACCLSASSIPSASACPISTSTFA